MPGRAADLQFSPDPAAAYFMVRYDDGQSELWATEDPLQRLTELGLGVEGHLFDPKSQRLLVWHTTGQAHLLDLAW